MLACCIAAVVSTHAATAVGQAPPADLAGGSPVPDDGVIAAPGSYFLTKDLLVDRNIGIEIKSDRVTLDLRGHALRFTGTPKPGIRGITAAGCSDITVSNGAVGGFWFNVHCTGSQRLRIRQLQLDDIPYLAVNVAGSKDVAITDNVFTNFRYDLPRPQKSTYLIGVNVTADQVLVANNRFRAEPPATTGHALQMETVFILFRPSQDCVVAHNQMVASEVLNRSYGVWVASRAKAAIFHNSVRNMQFGVCVATDGSATVGYNHIIADADASVETTGISASAAKVVEMGNTFIGLSHDTAIGQPAPQPQPTGGRPAGQSPATGETAP